jgi:hypothetical protein
MELGYHRGPGSRRSTAHIPEQRVRPGLDRSARSVGLFRRGRIDDATLDAQLDQVDAEAAELRRDIEQMTRELSTGDRTAQLQSAEELLQTVREGLAGPISNHMKRRIIEILVEKVEANTITRWGVAQSEITTDYRFSQPDEPAGLVLPQTHRLNRRKCPRN